jgi:hypothetical protein
MNASADNLLQMNARNRALCLDVGLPIRQQIYKTTQSANPFVAGQATTLNIPLLNVGLVKRLYVEISATVQQSAAETHTRTTLGPANFLSQIVLTDLNNLVRVNTSGWHLTLVNSARRGPRPYGSAATTDSPFGFGANYGFISAPASFTTAQAVKMMYEIPISYSDTDLRGAIWANFTNATFNLQLTINPNFSVANTANPVQACYQSSTTALAQISAYTITVYQEYLDQIPRNADGSYPVPLIDLATQYNLINTAYPGMAPGSDFPMPYANFRSFMSTVVVYDNAGTLNAGTDVNYIALSTANSLNLFKDDPYMRQFLTRVRIGDDFPKGCYYFDHRAKPISTRNYGNMNLIFNVSSAGTNAQFLTGYEFFAMTNQLQQAGSIGIQ